MLLNVLVALSTSENDPTHAQIGTAEIDGKKLAGFVAVWKAQYPGHVHRLMWVLAKVLLRDIVGPSYDI